MSAKTGGFVSFADGEGAAGVSAAFCGGTDGSSFETGAGVFMSACRFAAGAFHFLANGRHKAKTGSMECFNQSLGAAVVAKGLARGFDPAGNNRVGDEPAFPDRFNKFFARYDPFPLLDEMHQKGENLRFNGDKPLAAPQLVFFNIENEIFRISSASEKRGVHSKKCG